MPKARPHLTARTTGLLYHLHGFGAGGASAGQLAAAAGLRVRQASARLRWLQRVGLVRYSRPAERWQLTDDSMFRPPETEHLETPAWMRRP